MSQLKSWSHSWMTISRSSFVLSMFLHFTYLSPEHNWRSYCPSPRTRQQCPLFHRPPPLLLHSCFFKDLLRLFSFIFFDSSHASLVLIVYVILLFFLHVLCLLLGIDFEELFFLWRKKLLTQFTKHSSNIHNNTNIMSYMHFCQRVIPSETFQPEIRPPTILLKNLS